MSFPSTSSAADPRSERTGDTTAELDSGAIIQSWGQIGARRPQKQVVVSWAARSDIGRVRENNEDKYDFFLPDDLPTLATKGRLWAVADGMGGHNAGQIASEAALKTIVRSFFARDGQEVGGALTAAIAEANELIVQAARQFANKSGMGTTVTVAVLRDDQLTIANVGDSRAYLLRLGKPIRQLTVDHSWVEEQVRRGSLSREDAEKSPYRNVITRSIGMGDSAAPDLFVETVQPGDVYLLCSDGLSGYLDEPALANHLATASSPSAAALALVDAANDAGGRDNITALVISVRSVKPFPESDMEDE